MVNRDPAPLEVNGISFQYGPRAPILDGFSHVFSRGELTSITGRSGRGKSTLLYILGLLLKPAQGSVLVAGAETERLSDAARSRLRATHFGFVFQDAALDSTRTVLDNVCEAALYRGEPARAIHHRALGLLDSLGVSVRASAKPGQVSGGQAQRIALARALLHEPPVLLCDEPTGNLDDRSSDVVLDALRAHADAGGCVVVVTHSSRVVARCDREVLL